MKERPILFSAPMVRAILEGRKTQTRRVAPVSDFVVSPIDHTDLISWRISFSKPVGKDRTNSSFSGGKFTPAQAANIVASQFCQHGTVGDRLWVRETHAFIWPGDFMPDDIKDCNIEYRADTDGNSAPGDWPIDQRRDPDAPKWRPSIFTPRWASRITLEITEVRVERLQDISETDVVAEGIARFPEAGWHTEEGHFYAADPRESYAALWCDINGLTAWDKNPWVWVIKFKRIAQP